jgi:hypothetical protein
LKDAERCSVLWKKQQGNVVQLHSDVNKVIGAPDDHEDREAAAFIRVAAPRVIQVLFVLASNNDHHCELTSSAVRHIWPFLSSETWQHSVLQLLMEWSQRSVSVKAMAEFCGRYPKPHLDLLVEAITQETKKNVLPPGFEEMAKNAADGMDSGSRS